ncbi:MAG TPA: PKD domain-containing protein [Thermoplasmata archaeon]|nr:PKD domain-containing protein [Thermoplasmata archaeon]
MAAVMAILSLAATGIAEGRLPATPPSTTLIPGASAAGHPADSLQSPAGTGIRYDEQPGPLPPSTHLGTCRSANLCRYAADWRVEFLPLRGSYSRWAASQALGASVSASGEVGTIPFSVVFEATPFGGSQVYIRLLWDFGDGSSALGAEVEHTYPTSGTFTVEFVLVDSTGAIYSTNLTVHADPVPTVGGADAMPWFDWVVPPLVGIVSGAAVVLLGRRWGDRGSSSAPPPPGASTPGTGPWSPVPPRGWETAPAGPSPDEGRPAAPQVGAELRPRLPREVRRLSEELMVRLYTLGRLGPGDVPGSEWTQQGLSAALGVRQNVTSKLVRRLEAAGLVVSELGHVRDRPRRVLVYRLTSKGETIAGHLYRGRPPRTEPAE